MPVAIWFAGLRDSEICNINSGDGEVRIHRTENVRLTGDHNRCGRIMSFFLTRKSDFSFGKSAYLSVNSCSETAFSGAVTGGDGKLQHDGRNVWVWGSAAKSESIRLKDIHSSSTNKNVFIWLNQVSGIRIEGCCDQPRAAGSWSIHRGKDVSGVVCTNNVFHSRF